METELYHSDKFGVKIGPYVVGKDIPELFCINLRIRPEKKEQLIEEFKNYPVRFFTAELHTDPIRGCRESHIAVIEYAKQHNFSQVLVLEDDARIVRDLSTVPKFPDDWKLIYLGGLPSYIREWGDPWIKADVFCCHAYVVHASMYDKIIALKDSEYPYDDALAKVLQPDHPTYTVQESFVVQAPGYSDLNKRDKWVNYKWPKAGEQFMIP